MLLALVHFHYCFYIVEGLLVGYSIDGTKQENKEQET